ncbi:MAG: CDP-diacylglycerol--glycerol-3-phosphate 3-phosphatidyltransferase [Clostridia bacterium]|jgi:CDP-diacylglycerol--glycerol-3-phosphate 3-phosphatidyltransferase|nr:CDP-diacylglycerol--glycerol-3-phosphate 3-phosphatidyltransferase [Clostridia bacterium]MBP3587549.1 CDP-diacylglycerol--glycerol-3-phosphate 3-phosphatidyltransferase [Clostridia bacterium]MBR5245364.1 CDP-diacylglycerol--glycerol-3-phosphate 3-phosphatidyltransferase [Clostridia bacterium]
MTLPNILTCVRVLLIPVFMVLAYQNNMPCDIAALIVYVVACLTDYVDGYLARKNNQVTNFGKFMDPVADKLLVMAALLIFIEDGTIPAWAVAIILGREFIVSALRMVAASEGLVIAANMWGKAKTMITMITLIFLLCPIGPILLGPVSLQDIMIWITVIITAISGTTYITDNFAVIKDGFTQKGA